MSTTIRSTSYDQISECGNFTNTRPPPHFILQTPPHNSPLPRTGGGDLDRWFGYGAAKTMRLLRLRPQSMARRGGGELEPWLAGGDVRQRQRAYRDINVNQRRTSPSSSDPAETAPSINCILEVSSCILVSRIPNIFVDLLFLFLFFLSLGSALAVAVRV